MVHPSRPGTKIARCVIGLLTLGAAALAATPAFAQVVVAPNTSFWKPVLENGAPLVDPNNDSSTGNNEGEFVGDINNPTLFSFFDRGNLANLTDGTIYYRVRLGADQGGQPGVGNGFTGIVYLYVDANADNRVDFAIGVNLVNSNNERIGVFGVTTPTLPTGPPDTGNIVDLSGNTFNGSPYAYQTSANTSAYNWSRVYSSSLDLDPGDGDNVENLDGVANEPDYYLSFAVPFSDITAYASSIGISINENTPLGLVLSSGQSNTLNQDLSPGLNPDGSLNFTDPTAPTYFAVPEPSSLALVGGVALAGGGVLVRRRRGRG
jgi:hypothetical protein